jgi:hypothetical protein
MINVFRNDIFDVPERGGHWLRKVQVKSVISLSGRVPYGVAFYTNA